MKTVITLTKTQKRELPKEFLQDDNRYSESLVEYFLNEYTKKGDLVLDIFAGLGTTLFVAEEMKRIPYGIEWDKERSEYIRKNLNNRDNIINGDAMKLLEYNLPKCDFLLTSPPYMPKHDTENPFTAYTTQGSYEQYLQDYVNIFKQVKEVLKKESRVVVEIANLKNNGEVTTLAWDVAKKISKVLKFEGEVVINWISEKENVNERAYGYGYDHSYCLVFLNK